MKKFAMLFGYILGDGWIDIHKNGGVAGDIDGLQNIRKDLISLYDHRGWCNTSLAIKTRDTYSPKYNIKGTTSQMIFSNKISKSLIRAGMPIGKRVEQQYVLPDWIVNGSFEIKRDFMSGFYSAEGTKPIANKGQGYRYFKTLNFSQSKRIEFRDNFEYMMLKQYTKILDDLGIKYHVKIQYTHTCADNIRIRFDFSNSIDNTMYVCKLLDMRYCPRKQFLFTKAYNYYNDTRKLKKYGHNFPSFLEYIS